MLRRITDLNSPMYGFWAYRPAPKRVEEYPKRSPAEEHWSKLSAEERARFRRCYVGEAWDSFATVVDFAFASTVRS